MADNYELYTVKQGRNDVGDEWFTVDTIDFNFLVFDLAQLIGNMNDYYKLHGLKKVATLDGMVVTIVSNKTQKTNVSVEEKLKQLKELVSCVDPSSVKTKEQALKLQHIYWDIRMIIAECKIDPFDDGGGNLGNW